MHRPFAEGAFTHDQSAPVILKCAGYNFGSRSCSPVHQNDQGGARKPLALVCAEFHLHGGVSSTRGKNHTFIEESVGHRHGLLQHATRVVPEVNDQPSKLNAILFDGHQCLFQV